MFDQFYTTLESLGIVPVVVLDKVEDAAPLAHALMAAGMKSAEVTFRTAAGEAAIRAISREVPEMLVGAGTVLTHDQLDRALDAGARFIVSPGFNPDMVRYGLSKGALMVPGTATPGEMEQVKLQKSVLEAMSDLDHITIKIEEEA